MPAARMSKLALTAWLVTPLVVVAGFAVMFLVSPRPGQRLRLGSEQPAPVEGDVHDVLVPPEQLPQGFVIEVADRAASASSADEIVLVPEGGDVSGPGALRLAPDEGVWRINVAQPAGRGELRTRYVISRGGLVAAGADGKALPAQELPLVDRRGLRAGHRPVVRLVVDAWAEATTAGAAEPSDR